jgi:hypothetical protein
VPARKKGEPKPDPELVKSAEDMLLQEFRMHVQARHPQMRFRTKNEHVQDHRLHAEALDENHLHVENEPEGEKENAEGGGE